MSRIHPSSSSGSHELQQQQLCNNKNVIVEEVPPASSSPTRLTVWKRSSMSFQGTDGFTVYDRHGSLAFRVDNYSRNSRSCSSLAPNGGSNKALILMDGSGIPLLTLKPQIFRIQNQWNGCVYKEDDKGFPKIDKKLFMMKRPINSNMFVFGQTKNNKETQCEAEVFLKHFHCKEADGGGREASRKPDYRIEGSFWNRNCKIRSSATGEVAAKIMRKRSTAAGATTTMTSTIILSEEVFSLVVQPGFDPQLIMAFVIILDRICVKPVFTPLTCS